ncbi:hypothetical protein GLOIN_2v1787222 [Rhizophagus clarus]|uniref:Crinkler effector protein N-terminal domain-containing protein n=1 Tax=Rhizophagus clarus TaxID=94130 RepID=A0A8H3M2D3_9GLOM|nr:hypothetical protein GLOIN_2v1787222 [Rhizophagus clarus]
MTEYVFWCFLQGDSQRFSVYVNHESKTLYQLRELIRKGKKSVFRYTDPIDIVLWKIDLPYDEKVKLQNLEHHPDINTYVEEELHGKALLNPISTIETLFHEIYNIINELIEERIQQDKKAYKSLSELEIDIIIHVAKQQCVTSLEQDSPNTRERVGQTIKALEIEHVIDEFEYLQWKNRWSEIKKAILEKQMPNINSNVQFELWRNNVKLGKVSDMIK